MKNNINQTDLFGKVQMGYLVIESQKIDDWQRFLKQGMGLHLEHASENLLAFRMDQHARRLMIQRGKAEDAVAVGYQIADQASLDVILARLAERNIATKASTPEHAAACGVESFVQLKGPKGLTLELFVTAHTTDQPLNMLSGEFVTGDNGMGHISLTSRLPEKMERFWQEIFDARVSDRVSQKLAGVMLDIGFLRFNPRHHSIAIAATRGVRMDPIRSKIQHFNIVVKHRQDLFAAYERLRDLGYEMAHEIGQHPNDNAISFYVFTPSGFEMELGWDAHQVDESNWTGGAHYNAISSWGHHPEKNGFLNNLILNAGNAQRGVRSLLKPEYSPI